MAIKPARLKLFFVATLVFLAIACWILTFYSLRASPWEVRAKASSASAQLRNVSTALSAYFGDHSALPVSSEYWSNLTTPVAYVANILVDPFSDRQTDSIQFATSGTTFMIVSVGPDATPDIDLMVDFVADEASILEKIYDPTNGTKSPGDIIHLGSVSSSR